MIVAVIPLKGLAFAKSRLADALTDDDRRTLVCHLLKRTIDTVRQSGVVDCIAVTTEERTLAESLGVTWLPDCGDLNGSLAHSAKWAIAAGASCLLVLPADLPLLRAEDISVLVQTRPNSPSVCLAPTRDGGTGALLLTPPDVISPAFGPGSFRRHWGIARGRGLSVRALDRPGLAFDLDTCNDLSALCRK